MGACGVRSKGGPGISGCVGVIPGPPLPRLLSACVIPGPPLPGVLNACVKPGPPLPRLLSACVIPGPPLPGVLNACVKPGPPLPGVLNACVKPGPPVPVPKCLKSGVLAKRGWSGFQRVCVGCEARVVRVSAGVCGVRSGGGLGFMGACGARSTGGPGFSGGAAPAP